MPITVEIKIEDSAWTSLLLNAEEIVRRAAETAWKAGNVQDYEIHVDDVEISVVLTNDKTVQALNKSYRGVDKPTNVLSFAALDDEDEPVSNPFLAGDIIVAFETTKREAGENGKEVSDHLFHLIVHGVLHLIGYDHMDDEEAVEMESLETEILDENGIADPYAGTEE